MNTVSDRFHQLAEGSVRPLDWEVGISWGKERDPDRGWFTLDESALNSSMLLAEDASNPLQLWDAYNYDRSRDRVLSVAVERSVAFPYGVQSAVCDVSLNNYDGRYSVNNPNSPLDGSILPTRPIRAYLGFGGGAGVTPVFVGTTTAIPSYSGAHNSTATITAMDFLAQIGDMSLNSMVMMRNARTDEVIAVILEQFGLSPWMYQLKAGLNTIPFVYFESGKNAGNALRELIQAENGALWIDEAGIIQFAPRTNIIGSKSVATYTPTSIVSITPSATSGIVNKVHVEADVRKIMSFQQIFSAENSNGYSSSANEDAYRVRANSSVDIWVSFDDPIWQCQANPVLNGSDESSAFTAVNLSGARVNSKISAVGTLFATSMKLTFTNSNNFAVSIDYLQIWGEPARVVGGSPTITYDAEDAESIEKFGVQELSITDNNCFGSQFNIDQFATDVLKRYAGYSPTLDIQVKGDPSLQIHDIISLVGTDYDGDYKIIGVKHSLTDKGLESVLSIIKTEVVSPFILDVSVLNGADVLS